MSEICQIERRSRRWYRWLVAGICLLLIAGLVRLAYPVVRQRQITAELRQRGYEVGAYSAFGENLCWRLGGNNDVGFFLSKVFVSGESLGSSTDCERDLKLIRELFASTYDLFDEPAECHLTLKDPSVTDHGLKYLAGLTRITDLVLESPNITDVGMVHLKGLVKLSSLRLSNTAVADAGLLQLTGLPELSLLCLDGTRVTDQGLKSLAKANSLYELSLNETSIADKCVINLAGLINLKRLHLSNTQITDAGLAHFHEFASFRNKNFEELHLRGTQVTLVGVNALLKIKVFRFLDVSETRLTREELANLMRTQKSSGVYADLCLYSVYEPQSE
ncbi:MAG: hypothetical protein JW384_03968 [Nitrosomonadaceae bacterium]|nr:hypothetical protein [Nitrosomonadaceae bacterium]